MQKTVLITGSTDGIGQAAAKMLAAQGHHILLHGRSDTKLHKTEQLLAAQGNAAIESYVADLSDMNAVKAFADQIASRSLPLDVLVNNAGILKTPQSITPDGLDIRFAVNTIAPYLLTKRLLPVLHGAARIINLSSAAQSTVDQSALEGKGNLADMDAYAQSKLALTMWSRHIAQSQADDGPVIIAVNPGSLLGSKMVKEGFGIAGSDINIGAEIIVRLALDDEFADASGQYFDNDRGNFSSPHPDALDLAKCADITHRIEMILQRI